MLSCWLPERDRTTSQVQSVYWSVGGLACLEQECTLDMRSADVGLRLRLANKKLRKTCKRFLGVKSRLVECFRLNTFSNVHMCVCVSVGGVYVSGLCAYYKHRVTYYMYFIFGRACVRAHV